MNNTYKLFKGTTAEYKALHKRINKAYGQPKECESCGTTERKTEWANVSGLYKEIREDWERLCRRCHMRKDGRAYSAPFTGRRHREESKKKTRETMKKVWIENEEYMKIANRKSHIARSLNR